MQGTNRQSVSKLGRSPADYFGPAAPGPEGRKDPVFVDRAGHFQESPHRKELPRIVKIQSCEWH
jgi:hypothetical protein